MVHEPSYPYVVMSVMEVSVVKCLTNWQNTKVRVNGTFERKTDGHVLMGVRGKEEVYLSLDCVAVHPFRGEIVETFARLYKDQTDLPKSVIKLHVLFFRRLKGNFASYQRALALLKPFVPSFIRRKVVEDKDEVSIL